MAARNPQHAQSELFDATPPSAPAHVPAIAAQGAAPLGKEQVNFNRLVKKVNGLRDELAAWAAFAPRLQQRVMSELEPLQRQLSQARRATILSLGAILAGETGGVVSGKAERKSLTSHLVELATLQLVEDPLDAEIIALHDRYAELSFAEDQELERELTRDLAQEMFGIELEDEDLAGSVEDIMAAGLAKARQAAEEEEAAWRARRPRGEKARARAEQKAAAAEQAATEVSQSVREVYRKLASALHPDRAADEADRARRHEAMQRVNQAYEARDLLSLLTLQLEIEQIDAAHLAQVSKVRLGHYNTVLREQVRELEQELAFVVGHYRMLLVDEHALRVTPDAVLRSLSRELVLLRRAIGEVEAHHAMLLEPGLRKQWAKQYAKEQRADERSEQSLMELLMDGPIPFDDDAFAPPIVRTPRASSARKPRGRRRRS